MGWIREDSVNAGKRQTAQQINAKPQEAEVHHFRRLSIAQTRKPIGITDQIYRRCRRE